MAQVTWTPQALDQLDAIGEFVAQDSESRAEKVVSRLFLSAERLRLFPESGRIIPERVDERLRELIVGDYRLMYRLKDGEVEVIAVAHGRRRFRVADC